MTVKTPNYTDEMVARMKEAYDPSATAEDRKVTVEALADELKKPVKSIVAKLANMKIYVKAERTDKTGAEIVKKEDLATEIGETLNMTEADATSMAKANKTALKVILEAITG